VKCQDNFLEVAFMLMNRREFATVGSISIAGMLTRNLWADQTLASASSDKFYFAAVADTHIIDGFYHGHENSELDTSSLYHTTARLTSARDLINSLKPKIEQVFIAGDYFHNYPSTDYDFYFKNVTRLDNAKAITDGFKMPVHLGFGNHDYDVKNISREMSHRLFAAKFNAKPYSVLDYKGYKFIHLNNFLGSTQDHTSPDFNPGTGSLGEEQLHWFEAQLQQRKPTFVFLHFPLIQVQDAEFGDYGLHPLLRAYRDTIQLVISGHLHKWIDFAHTYGPQHYTIASTRYDENAYMLMEVDTKHGTWKFVNAELVNWSTHYSKPYHGI
jgi:hypothetical protein